MLLTRCMYVCTHACMHACMIYHERKIACMYVCVCAYIYIYTHRHRHINMLTRAHIHTDRTTTAAASSSSTAQQPWCDACEKATAPWSAPCACSSSTRPSCLWIQTAGVYVASSKNLPRHHVPVLQIVEALGKHEPL